MGGYVEYYGYMAVAGVLSLIGMYISGQLKSRFKKYSRMPVASGLSGAEIAQQMLHHYGIFNVNIVEGRGVLTDHYNPQSKTVSLSPEVFHGRSVAAAAVAAHECGHAVQHAQAYAMLQFRSAIVPVVQFSANIQQFILLAAFLLLNQFPQIMLIAIITFAITTLFSFVTLPVEFDASKRALAWLNETGNTRGQEYEGAKDALKWAAMTYVSAALSSLVMLLYLVLRYMGSRD